MRLMCATVNRKKSSKIDQNQQLGLTIFEMIFTAYKEIWGISTTCLESDYDLLISCIDGDDDSELREGS